MIALLIIVAPGRLRAAGEPHIIGSSLRSATVYRSGAELVHTATATLLQGNNDLIIDDIANKIDPNTLRVSCTGNTTVMSMTFSTEYLKPESASPYVRRLQDSIESIKKELSRLDALTKSDNELLGVLSANKTIAGSNGLTVTELSKMMDYYKQKTIELRTELNGYQERTAKYTQLLEKINNQVQEEEKKNGKTAGRILLQLLSPVAGTVDLTVTYLTQAASWTPFYDLKVDNASDPLHILYKARLTQSSGIDWKKVKLHLSTSVPGRDGNAPILKAWFLQFIDPMSILYKDKSRNDLSNTLSGRAAGLQVQPQLNEVVVVGYGTSSKSEYVGAELPAPFLYVVNGEVMEEKDFKRIDPRAFSKIEVLKSSEATAIYGSRAAGGAKVVTLRNELSDYVSVNDNQMDVTFDIDLPYEVPGNGKEQGVVLKEFKVPCTYRYYAAPRLDKDAYLLGEVPGWEKLNLLPGEANIIVEGTLIGKSFIDPNSIQDTMNLTLGRDKRIVVKKEKVVDYSSVKFLGANKRQTFTYDITVRNNKKEKVDLLLKDQYPLSSSKDIEEELLQSSGAEINTETGVLTWKLQLAAGESRKYRVSYSIKYPKDRTVNL